MKMMTRQIIAFLQALILLLSFEQGPAGQPEQNGFSQEAQRSLIELRSRMDMPGMLFGAALLGYVEGDAPAGSSAFLQEVDQALLKKYPFIKEIQKDQIIGSAGFLYCIVPLDENATVAINRVQWNPATGTDEITEVVYRQEYGKPVLLFANLDGVAYESDTQVTITDNKGNSCQWEPSLDGMSRLAPCTGKNGENALFDFTEYGWLSAPPELAQWLADGWSGMTAVGLSGPEWNGKCWVAETTAWDTGRDATFYLWFLNKDETGGSVYLDWIYKDGYEPEEMWSGFWTIQTVPDGPSYVTISLSLVGGNRYDTSDGPMYLSETYPMLIDPSGLNLVVGNGGNTIGLPFLSQEKQNAMTPCELTLLEESYE